MESLADSRPPMRIPAGFLGMLALVIVIEACIGRWYPLAGYHVRFDWELTAKRATREAVRSEILCFGDSQIKLDVQPRVLEAALGRPTTNLAIVGGQAPSSYFLLRRALQAGAKPKAIIIDFFPSLMHAGLAFNTEQWPRLLKLPEALQLFGHGRDPSLFAHWAVRRTLRSYDRRERVRENIMIALRGETGAPTMEGLALSRNTRLNQGALVAEENPNNRDDITHLPAWERPLPFECDPANAFYIQKCLELAEAHQIRVFWVLTPCVPSWQAESDERDPNGLLEQTVRRWAGSYHMVQVIDARRAGYRHNVFRDQTHLDHHGASAFSADLALLVKRELETEVPRERWVNMPLYHERPEAIDLEDMGESRQAVRSVYGAIRR